MEQISQFEMQLPVIVIHEKRSFENLSNAMVF